MKLNSAPIFVPLLLVTGSIVFGFRMVARIPFLPEGWVFLAGSIAGFMLCLSWNHFLSKRRSELGVLAFTLARTKPPFRKGKALAWAVASILLMAAMFGQLVSAFVAFPVLWFASRPYAAEVSVQSQYRMRGFHAGMTQLKLRDLRTGETITLSWPNEVQRLIGSGQSLSGGARLQLNGRTSWAGTVIDSMVGPGTRGTVTLHSGS